MPHTKFDPTLSAIENVVWKAWEIQFQKKFESALQLGSSPDKSDSSDANKIAEHDARLDASDADVTRSVFDCEDYWNKKIIYF